MRAPDRRCVLRLPSDVADVVLGATRRYQTRYGSSHGLRPSGDHLLPGTHKPPGTILKQAGCWEGRHVHIPVFTSVCSIFTTGFGLPTDARCGPHRGRNTDLLHRSLCDHSHQHHRNTNRRCSRSAKPLFTFKRNWQPELRLLLPCQSKSAFAICSSMLSARLVCSKNLPSQLLLRCDSAQGKQQEVFLIPAHTSCAALTQDTALRQVYFSPGIHLSWGGSEPM